MWYTMFMLTCQVSGALLFSTTTTRHAQASLGWAGWAKRVVLTGVSHALGLPCTETVHAPAGVDPIYRVGTCQLVT
jgi:hypothetical protein